MYIYVDTCINARTATPKYTLLARSHSACHTFELLDRDRVEICIGARCGAQLKVAMTVIRTCLNGGVSVCL